MNIIWPRLIYSMKLDIKRGQTRFEVIRKVMPDENQIIESQPNQRRSESWFLPKNLHQVAVAPRIGSNYYELINTISDLYKIVGWGTKLDIV